MSRNLIAGAAVGVVLFIAAAMPVKADRPITVPITPTPMPCRTPQGRPCDVIPTPLPPACFTITGRPQPCT